FGAQVPRCWVSNDPKNASQLLLILEYREDLGRMNPVWPDWAEINEAFMRETVHAEMVGGLGSTPVAKYRQLMDHEGGLWSDVRRAAYRLRYRMDNLSPLTAEGYTGFLLNGYNGDMNFFTPYFTDEMLAPMLARPINRAVGNSLKDLESLKRQRDQLV